MSSKDASSQEEEDWRAGFASVTEGVANQIDQRTALVEAPVWETELLLGDDGGWNVSLANREC
jgi:hypothetical protein